MSAGAEAVAGRRLAGAGPVLDLLGAAALWGGMYVVSSATFERIPPLTLGLLRLVVGVLALVVVFRGHSGCAHASLRRVAAAGAIVALTLVLQFVGTELTGAAEGALLTTTTPAFVLLFGALLEGRPTRRPAWFGVAVALAGVALIALRRGDPFAAPADPDELALRMRTIGPLSAAFVGDLLLVASAATWALFSTVGRPLVERVGAFRAILQASVVAIVLLAPLAGLELAGRTSPLPGLDTAGLLAVGYLGVMATAVAWSLWYRGYAAARPRVSAAAFFAQPVVGAALGVAFLGEVLTAGFVAGAVLVAVGVLVIARPDGA